MSSKIDIDGEDIPIEKLIPLNERRINLKTNRGYHKIVSSIKSIGLIQPLCVYPENSHYVILDGFLRFKAVQQLGVKNVPCIVYQTKEAYTFNRMVNRLSPYQQSRMLRKSLETLDHSEIEKVLGIKSLKFRLGTELYEHLHPEVIKKLDGNKISRRCAEEFTYVNKNRQLQILREMKKCSDFSISFARALVIKTSPKQRNKKKKTRKTWSEDSNKKQELVDRLVQVQERYDFFATLYRQYTADLLKLSIYVRKLITNEVIRDYLNVKFPDLLRRFEGIVLENDSREPIAVAG
jgi:ParB-like chromosome segregation protein Spo0J